MAAVTRLVRRDSGPRKVKEQMKFHRGRLIDHIRIAVRDIDASKKFYQSVLGALGISFDREEDDWFLVDELLFSQAARRSGKMHLAFQASSRDAVEQFFEAGIRAGGKALAEPAVGNVHPYYYSSKVKDPDGNIIEVVNHGPVTRSADSVVVKPSALAALKGLF